MNNFKLAVFDMAGTTVEEGGSVYRVLKESIEQEGYAAPQDKISQIAGMSKYEAIKFILPKDDAADDKIVGKIFKAFSQKLNEIYLNDPSVQEKPGISSLFTALRDKGILIALNTGYSRTQADILIEKLKWQELIDYSVTSDEVERGRPHPDMIQLLMKKTGIREAGTIIKVGDTVNDILEGKNAGCGMTVGVEGGAHTKTQMEEAGAEKVLRQTSDLNDLITSNISR